MTSILIMNDDDSIETFVDVDDLSEFIVRAALRDTAEKTFPSFDALNEWMGTGHSEATGACRCSTVTQTFGETPRCTVCQHDAHGSRQFCGALR